MASHLTSLSPVEAAVVLSEADRLYQAQLLPSSVADEADPLVAARQCYMLAQLFMTLAPESQNALLKVAQEMAGTERLEHLLSIDGPVL